MSVRETENGTIITVKVVPNSSRNEISSDSEGRVTVRLTSPPVEGRANKGLLKILGKKLGIAPSCITIVKGQGSREKTVHISGLDQDQVRGRLE
jgi:uncharacterized protein (TIGR00251 family)